MIKPTTQIKKKYLNDGEKLVISPPKKGFIMIKNKRLTKTTT